MNNQSHIHELVMTTTRKETTEERINPPLDSHWNRMAVPTLDILEEVLNEIKKQQETENEKNDIPTQSF
jgi:hypothetical protein